MKRLFYAALLLVAAPLAAWAQPNLSNNPQAAPRFRSNGAENSGFGVKGGVNFNSIQGDGLSKMYSGSVDGLTQYHVGAYAQIGISNRLSVQPELLYMRKGFKATEMLPDGTSSSKATTRLSYLSVPVILAINVFDNVAIHLGPQVSYLLNVHDSSKKVDSEAYNYNSLDVGAVGGLEAKIEFLRIGARYDYSLTDLREGKDFQIANVTRKAEADIRNGSIQVYVGVGL